MLAPLELEPWSSDRLVVCLTATMERGSTSASPRQTRNIAGTLLGRFVRDGIQSCQSDISPHPSLRILRKVCDNNNHTRLALSAGWPATAYSHQQVNMRVKAHLAPHQLGCRAETLYTLRPCSFCSAGHPAGHGTTCPRRARRRTGTRPHRIMIEHAASKLSASSSSAKMSVCNTEACMPTPGHCG